MCSIARRGVTAQLVEIRVHAVDGGVLPRRGGTFRGLESGGNARQSMDVLFDLCNRVGVTFSAGIYAREGLHSGGVLTQLICRCFGFRKKLRNLFGILRFGGNHHWE